GFAWQMPQGGIDPGETPYQAALRELQEETNVTSVSLLAEVPVWLSYDLPVDIGQQAWKGRWRGQAQKWFAFRLDGPDSEIDILHP
ncbi:RNA pyrophosphohydrolase, partial [Lysobacter sp. 2RAB21]